MTSLRTNLQELYSACNSKGALVPHPFSRKVYDSGYGWGRIWKWFYSVLEHLFCKDFKTERLQKTMEKTQAVFSSRFAEVQESLHCYQEYLKDRISDEKIDEKEIHPYRKRITLWNRSTTPFLSLSKDKTSTLFEKYYPDDAKPFNTENLTESLQLAQHLINLEGYLHSPLPLNLLGKLARAEALTKTDKKQLKKWIKTLNTKKEIPQKAFHTALVSLVQTIGSDATISNLEMGLTDLNLKLFLQPEPSHINWRETLQPGEVLSCGGKEYILDEPLLVKEEDDGLDHTLLFTIKDQPEKVIAIGINPSFMRLKEQMSQKYQWGVEMPAIYAIEENGKFAVMERMQTPLSERTWTASAYLFPFEEKKILDPLVNMIKWWFKQSLTPLDFSLKHLMFDNKGSLKYTHLLMPELLNFSFLEDLIVELANGNLTVYLYLMKESTLRDHLVIDFYHRMVTNAVDNKPANAKNLAACRKITDPEVIKRGKSLYKQSQEMRKQVLKKLSKEYCISDRATLKKTLNAMLTTWHKKNCTASSFWPDTEASIIRNLILECRLKPKFRDDP